MSGARRFALPLPHGGELVLGERTLVMGILNVTPDSFSDGGRHDDADRALGHAEELIAQGADLLDVGGESTRPGAPEISDAEQIGRVARVIESICARAPDVPISIDTRSAAVARAAVEAGAAIVNDVSGLTHDPLMRATVAELGAPAVVMHMRGTPADMRERTTYTSVVDDVLRELRHALDAARASGIEHLIADPGIGFAKDADQSLELLAATARFHELDVPVLVGPSRKSFLAPLLDARGDEDPADHRADASVAAAAIAALGGADIVRVHDVGPCLDGVRVADAVARVRRATAS